MVPRELILGDVNLRVCVPLLYDGCRTVPAAIIVAKERAATSSGTTASSSSQFQTETAIHEPDRGLRLELRSAPPRENESLSWSSLADTTGTSAEKAADSDSVFGLSLRFALFVGFVAIAISSIPMSVILYYARRRFACLKDCEEVEKSLDLDMQYIKKLSGMSMEGIDELCSGIAFQRAAHRRSSLGDFQRAAHRRSSLGVTSQQLGRTEGRSSLGGPPKRRSSLLGTTARRGSVLALGAAQNLGRRMSGRDQLDECPPRLINEKN